MQRNRIGFWLLALGAAVLAACSTGGGGGTVVPQGFQALAPPAAQSFVADARHRRHHPVRAVVYLRIPAPRHHRHRGRRMHPNYVSPGTASISFAVQPISGSSGSGSTPMPLQTMNVVTPAPCATISPTDAALQCKFTVSVMPGSDSFVVTTYSGLNATGKALSEYTSGSTIIPTPDPKGNIVPLGFTLEGVVDHVVLQFPNSVVPADTQGQAAAIPAGVPTSAPLNVTPYDAANYQIFTQMVGGAPVPYAAPITLTMSPSGKGFTLSNASGSGNTVTISNPNDLAVSINYDGTFTTTLGSISAANSTFAIGATGSTLAAHPRRKLNLYAPRAATPMPNTGGVQLSGNTIPGGTYTTTLTSPSPAGLVNIPGTSSMAFIGSGYNNSQAAYASILGTATAGAATLSGEPLNTAFTGAFADNLGNIWTWDNDAYQIDCFAATSLGTPAGTIPSATIYSGMTSGYFGGFTEDSSNNLWFAAYGYWASGGFESVGYVPINATSCTSPAPVIYNNVGTGLYPDATAIAPISGKASVNVAAYDPNGAGAGVQVAATGAPTPNVTLAAGTQPNALFPGSTTYAYASGTLGTVSPAGVFTGTITYPTDLGSFINNTTSTAASSQGVLGATLYNGNFGPFNFVTLLNTGDTNSATNLLVLAPAPYCNGIAFDAQDTAWTFCTNPQGNLQFYHIIPTSTWSLTPGTTVQVGVTGCTAPFTGSSFVGVLEAFGATAGPFNLTNYNTSVISGVTQEGSRGISFTITEPAGGTYVETADVVDKGGRTVPVTLDIDASAQACSKPRPGIRAGHRLDPHARRGYPPVSRN